MSVGPTSATYWETNYGYNEFTANEAASLSKSIQQIPSDIKQNEKTNEELDQDPSSPTNIENAAKG